MRFRAAADGVFVPEDTTVAPKVAGSSFAEGDKHGGGGGGTAPAAPKAGEKTGEGGGEGDAAAAEAARGGEVLSPKKQALRTVVSLIKTVLESDFSQAGCEEYFEGIREIEELAGKPLVGKIVRDIKYKAESRAP